MWLVGVGIVQVNKIAIRYIYLIHLIHLMWELQNIEGLNKSLKKTRVYVENFNANTDYGIQTERSQM